MVLAAFIYCTPTDKKELNRETPDTFLEIRDTVEQKISALKQHSAQLASERDKDAGTFVRSSVQRIGQHKGVPPAETFKRIQVHN